MNDIVLTREERAVLFLLVGRGALYLREITRDEPLCRKSDGWLHLSRLARRGLVHAEKADWRSPLRYTATEAGKAWVAEHASKPEAESA